ncbi:vWA domain-containing protein [Flammeovirga agarivorans]|uniref:VWA domain-containing protein n=1 Tax=Flammeovirga agarivorans TaxID=2726742 RepID=A0A7X8XVM0_9BACT|nr:vWA domain-containing protein [Flammeovirga agarivorans]NLR91472.1 VWA domain-containing protein [Flammeovirga agarivorans]
MQSTSIFKQLKSVLLFSLCLLCFSCGEGSYDIGSDDFSESAEDSGGSTGGPQSGLVTAGEWNDLSNWEFWNDLLQEDEFSIAAAQWNINTNNRFSFLVTNNSTPVINAKIELLKDDTILWTSKTDNHGYAEVWLGAYEYQYQSTFNSFSIKVNDELLSHQLIPFDEGANEINITSESSDLNRVEISFIVDATGSMDDELEFLKEDLKSVIENVMQSNSTLDIYTSTVFYRDEGEEYVTRKSDFTNQLSETIAFITQQEADGGGDFPEAVHTALDLSINELQWSENAKTRIAFLLLDAPPHENSQILDDIKNTIQEASRKGIKIIPIAASGIDKPTEFLLRYMAILTNGTYVFITNDSGIGNDHLIPSVGQYDVEYLNELMIRLINEYTE